MSGLPYLRHVLAQFAQAQAQPLDEKQRALIPSCQACQAVAQVRQAHPQQPCPCCQALPSGVAITDDCQHKGCLRSRVCAAGAVTAVKVLDEVLLPAVFHQVHLRSTGLLRPP